MQPTQDDNNAALIKAMRAAGNTFRETAAALHISEATLKTYQKKLLAKGADLGPNRQRGGHNRKEVVLTAKLPEVPAK